MAVDAVIPPRRREPGRAGPIIVVGFDGSDESRRAVEIAVERAGFGGTVIPLHVTRTLPGILGARYYEPELEAAYQNAQSVLDEVEQIEPGLATVEPELIEGEPADALMRVARSRGAREIVVGARGRRFRGLLGSVSRKLIRRADRPVVIVPQGAVDAR